MQVTLHYDDGRTRTFQADSVKTVNDVAFVDGILQTGVGDVDVGA